MMLSRLLKQVGGTVSDNAVPSTSRLEPAWFGEQDIRDSGDKSNISAAVDSILHKLTEELRRDLGIELKVALRMRLSHSSPFERADLAAVVDDIFHVSPDVPLARVWALNVLEDPAQLQKVMSYWPGYPSVEEFSESGNGHS